MKIRLFLVFALFVFCSGMSQTNGLELPKYYIAQHTTELISIDGEAKEHSWKKVTWSDDFIDIEGEKTPKYRTRMKMMYDDTHFYFYAELEEPHIWGNLKNRDTIIYHNNDFEIFIDPDGDTHNYYEFEMNALNTVWDLLLTKPYRNGATLYNNWDFKNIKTAVHIKGTLNNPADIDSLWSVEIAIPWKAIYETFNNRSIVPKGKTWRINFSRVNWDHDLVNNVYQKKKDPNTGKTLREYNWVWSPQGVINMHEPEKWGYVYFSSKPIGSNETFNYGKDEELKLHLYQFYRNYRRKIKDAESWKNATFKKSISLNDQIIPVKAEFSTFEYYISVKSPNTGKLLAIRSDGKFRIN